ncbi:TspO/MBR family protein [Jonesiaceae bacterium BS-20]|uniref:TspO/MBR family protein n=1 Tax=Jonesiaceae bacterium BS-20 TaxID=3120821 RepID=A0AAU7DZN1_9MICO
MGSLATIPNTKGWYLDVEKVAWNPSNWVFGSAWSLLYLLITLAGFLIWRSGCVGQGQENAAKSVLWAFGIQLGLNSIWKPIF